MPGVDGSNFFGGPDAFDFFVDPHQFPGASGTVVVVTGSGVGTLSLSGVGTGEDVVVGTGVGLLSLSGTGSGSVVGTVTGTGVGQLILSGTGAGAAVMPGGAGTPIVWQGQPSYPLHFTTRYGESHGSSVIVGKVASGQIQYQSDDELALLLLV